jgi:hypothetical protein
VEQRTYWTVEYMGVTFDDATYINGLFYHHNVYGELISFVDQKKVRVLRGPHGDDTFHRDKRLKGSQTPSE